MTDAPRPAVLAVDVAILPPPELRHQLIGLNGMLSGPPEGFRFDDTHLPHVTLVQQFVEIGRLDSFTGAVGHLCRDVKPLPLETAEVGRGTTSVTLGVGRTPALADLHQRLMDDLRPFDAGDGTLASFVSDRDSPRTTDLDWVAQYRARAAYDRYDPHITLGVGAFRDAPAPASFIASQLALCHLGRHCTCRRVIAQWSLTPPE